MSKEVEYKQGNTTAWSDGDKIVIRNPSGKSHLEENVDRIFGVGEYKKIFEVKYSFEEERVFNPYAKKVELISGYIPQRVIDDLGIEKKLPGIKDKDLTKGFFDL